MGTPKTDATPDWAIKFVAFNSYLTQDLFGGPKVLKMAWVINLHKALIIPVVGFLMVHFDNHSTAAWVYLGLHGSYGVCWLVKHAVFRDSRWEARATYAGAAFTFLLLATYWVAPFLLISEVLGAERLPPPTWLLGVSVGLFVVGITTMEISDCQKHYALKARRALITDGMFRHIRHPNYLGEMMLYAALALLVQHWIPWAILAYWWLCVFLVNMLVIEGSVSRYPEWRDYRSKTGMLLPWRVLYFR